MIIDCEQDKQEALKPYNIYTIIKPTIVDRFNNKFHEYDEYVSRRPMSTKNAIAV